MIQETQTVGTFEAKTHLSRLLDAVEAGGTGSDHPPREACGQLSAPPKKKRARFGCAKGEGFYMAPDFDAPLEEFKDYM